MQLINKAHPAIAAVANFLQNRGNAFVRISGKEVYFSALACRLYELNIGDYLEFIEMDGAYFFANTGDEVGFRLSFKTRTSHRIINRALVRLLNNDKRVRNYSLEKTGENYCGKILIKLIEI